ncbi:MAG TPA: undecaprenyl-phosphate glucose phosphotransferase [Thermoanaerobaculia bacterium]|nr:undecaprenyl-phosphate glucose phosphotransferase [Thermoanaerobaculia bacterium]
MIQKKHQTLSTVYMVIDALASNLAMLVAYYLRFAVEVIPLTKGQQDLSIYTYILPLVTIVFPLSFAVQGLYQIRPTKSRSEEWASVAIATLLGTVVLSGLLLWIRPANAFIGYSRATLLIFAISEIAIVILVRSLVRLFLLRRYRAGKNLDRVLIAGNGELARAVADRMRAHEELGLKLVGYAENGENGVIEGLQCLGKIASIESILDEHEIDHVFVALPQHSAAAMMELLDRLMRHCVSLHVVPDLLQFMTLRSRVEDIDGLPTINLSETPLTGWSRVVKRAFDLLLAGTALVVLSPLIVVIALLIYLEDKGPIFYRQERMGLDGVPFQIMKFRSMHQAAEAQSGAVWASAGDARRTRIGGWLRGWSLDELPQLWNVIRGDMSLVGPRPERPQFVEQFRSEYPHYMLRHKVRAGMTGWAQVHGWRGNTSIRIRIEHDLYYIENWSMLLDVKILFMTVRHGLRHENAY